MDACARGCMPGASLSSLLNLKPYCGKYDHISSALAELHWLPVKQRVSFTVATLTFNIKRENQPSYLGALSVTMRHLVACVRPPRIFCVSTAAELLSAHVLFDMSPPTHGTVCLVLFAIVTIFVLLNLNLKRTYLNKLLLTVHTSHIVVTAPTNSFLLHTARYKFYLLTYLLTCMT